MILAEYKTQLTRLQNRYGTKTYDEEFSMQLWSKIKPVEISIFTKVVDELMGNHFRPLGVYAIMELVFSESEKLVASRAGATRFPFADCLYCDGHGLVKMKYQRDKRECYFACGSCQNGKKQNEFSKGVLLLSNVALRAGYDFVEKPRTKSTPLQSQISPWPRFLEYLMLMIRDGNTNQGFDYACRFNRVSEEEAWRMWDLFSEKQFNDPFALKIIARSRGQSFSSLLMKASGNIEPTHAV